MCGRVHAGLQPRRGNQERQDRYDQRVGPSLFGFTKQRADSRKLGLLPSLKTKAQPKIGVTGNILIPMLNEHKHPASFAIESAQEQLSKPVRGAFRAAIEPSVMAWLWVCWQSSRFLEQQRRALGCLEIMAQYT